MEKWEVTWLNQNGVASQGRCLHNTLAVQDIYAPHDTDMTVQIFRNVNKRICKSPVCLLRMH
jgi:hypothetical protein